MLTAVAAVSSNGHLASFGKGGRYQGRWVLEVGADFSYVGLQVVSKVNLSAFARKGQRA